MLRCLFDNDWYFFVIIHLRHRIIWADEYSSEKFTKLKKFQPNIRQSKKLKWTIEVREVSKWYSEEVFSKIKVMQDNQI